MWLQPASWSECVFREFFARHLAYVNGQEHLVVDVDDDWVCAGVTHAFVHL